MTVAAILGIGMTTAAGPDAKTSAAAFRAKISRARELDYFAALDDEQTAVGPIAGYVAVPNAVHAEGLGKMVALGAAALRRALDATATQLPGARTGAYLAVPNYSLREEAFVDVGSLADAGTRYSSEAPEDYEVPRSIVFAEHCRDHLLDRLARAARVQFTPSARGIFFGDNCAFLRALDAGITAVMSGEVDRCVVGGIDSYVDVPSLEWGMLRRRMKCETNPVGFAPGEAAVFLVLTAPHLAGSHAVGYVSQPAFGEEPAQIPASEVEPPRGVGFAQAIRLAMQNGQRAAGLVIADMNGEPQRAMDWGYALVRSAPELPSLRDAPVWTPAEAFGETGCASAGLAIGVAVEALARRYARTDAILILSSSETGDRGAAVVSASPASN